MKLNWLPAALLTSLASGLAHAEGNYSNLKLTFIWYILIAMAVMAFQAIYILCLGGATATRKLVWVLGLTAVDAFAVFLLYWLTLETKAIDLEGPVGYVLVVIPAFVYIAIIKGRLAGKAGNA